MKERKQHLLQINPEKRAYWKKHPVQAAKRVGAATLMTVGAYHIADKAGAVNFAREKAGEAVTAVGEAITPDKGSDTKGSAEAKQEKPTISFTASQGDTLWDYAQKFYPDEDPRAVVDELQGIPANEDGLQYGEQVTLQVSQEVADQFHREQEQATQQAQGK